MSEPTTRGGNSSQRLAGAGRNREDEVDDGVVAAVDGAGDRPVGLLDLPDELLVHVYETLATPDVEPFIEDSLSSKRTHFNLPLRTILLNRRIYALALPLRQQVLFVTALCARERLFPECQQVGLQKNLRFLDVRLWKFPASLAEHIAQLKSLTTLRLTFESHLPLAFTQQLKQCTQLKHLYLAVRRDRSSSRDGIELREDPAFSLPQHMPFLKTVWIDLRNGGEDLLDRGLPSVSSFGLLYNWPHVLKARWWTVPTVHLRPSAGYFREPYDFVKKLKEVTRPDADFSVNYLIIQVTTLSPTKSDDPDEYYYEQVIPEMLELLQRTSTLERLDFVEFGTLQDWSKSGISLPSVKTLRLCAEDYGWEPITAETILSFVVLFPSLTTFLLAGCDLLTTETAKTIDTATQDPLHPSLPSPASLLASEKPLRALLNKLLLTPVVGFRYRVTKDSSVELRFSREKSGEGVGFEGEWWWL